VGLCLRRCPQGGIVLRAKLKLRNTAGRYPSEPTRTLYGVRHVLDSCDWRISMRCVCACRCAVSTRVTALCLSLCKLLLITQTPLSWSDGQSRTARPS
jgi:hypothetical protein